MNVPQTISLPVHILSIGPFGRAVVKYLRSLRSDIVETPVDGNTLPIPETWPPSRVTAVAGWRVVPGLCELMEESSYRSQRPFVPLFQSSSLVRLGPVVIPGAGPCWTCWSQRYQQHAEWPEAETLLQEHYARNGEVGPRGFLEPFAMIAASRLSTVFDQASRSTSIAGYIWQIDMLTREIAVSKTVGVHGCARCGLQRSARTRTVVPLKTDLEYLWSAVAVKGSEAE